jgi:AcrR family transcriptional regulator
VVSAAARADWREGRRRSAQAAILDAAWAAVRDQGLAGLSMRDLASRAGITPPTVYAYFASKNDIYDAMFGQAAAEFAAHIEAPYPGEGATQDLIVGARRFVAFCTEDVARYQLLFQRTIPGFEPSAQSYAPAVAALEGARRRLSAHGITDERHVDMWTALVTGLVDQQISNDPGGQRWISLIDEAVDMYLSHCVQPGGPSSGSARRRGSPSRPKGATSDDQDR